jgi:enoyl-CoA hydratase
VTIGMDAGLATLRLGREHGNAINGELVGDLHAAVSGLEQDPAVRGALLAASGKLFCPGLDLQELIELERPAMEAFLARFNAMVLALYTFSKPLVAALHGHAVAGGCVLALTADWRVLRPGALVGLNELRVGVSFPFGVATILRESVPAPKLEEVALFGRNYEGEAAVAAGLAHELHGGEGFEAHCRSRLAELAERDGRAFAATKGSLRWAAVERIRRHEAERAGDFLDSWFSPATRERLRGIVQELRGRKK